MLTRIKGQLGNEEFLFFRVLFIKATLCAPMQASSRARGMGTPWRPAPMQMLVSGRVRVEGDIGVQGLNEESGDDVPGERRRCAPLSFRLR